MSASVSLVRTPFWHMRKPGIQSCENAPGVSTTLRSASTFYTSTERLTRLNLLKCAFTQTQILRRMFTIIFPGSFHYFKPVSCWILFCENVAGIPLPFDQLPSRRGKVNTFKNSEMRLYFKSDVLGGCLTIIFVGSFPYFIKFLTKINSKVRRKQPANDWPVADCFGRLPALIDSTVNIV